MLCPILAAIKYGEGRKFPFDEGDFNRETGVGAYRLHLNHFILSNGST